MKISVIQLLVIYIAFIITTTSSQQWLPSFNGTLRLNIRNNCKSNIVIFLDPAKPPCDREARKVPIGKCKGVDGSGWNNAANGKIPQKFLLRPGQIQSISVLRNPTTRKTEWCFDENNKRTCSGSGGWVGYDCDPKTLKNQSGDQLRAPFFPGRFEINFNPLPDGSIFYNLSGVDGINVNMIFTATGACAANQKKNYMQCQFKKVSLSLSLIQSLPFLNNQ